MSGSKDRKTTITLEPGRVAVVLGMEDGQISRQLFAGPELASCSTIINRRFRVGGNASSWTSPKYTERWLKRGTVDVLEGVAILLFDP
jgi:hypothetical protein